MSIKSPGSLDSLEIRASSRLQPAVILLALFSFAPFNLPAQSQKACDSNTPQQKLQHAAAALPQARTARALQSVAAANGHFQTINLPGASDEPPVHSPFQTKPAFQQAGNRAGNDSRQRSALDFETAPPMPSSPSGKYTGSLRIMLTSNSPATRIYFTLDGTEPTTSSFLYNSPFKLTSSATLKAFAVAEGKSPSQITTAEYKIVPPSLGFELGSNGIDQVEIFLSLNAPGAASVAGEWTLRDGATTLCSANLTTETRLHCAAKLNRGSHNLIATYTGTHNGWRLTAGSTLRVN